MKAYEIVNFLLNKQYALRKEFPQGSRKKFNADLIFNRKLLDNCYKSPISDTDGIIRYKKTPVPNRGFVQGRPESYNSLGPDTQISRFLQK